MTKPTRIVATYKMAEDKYVQASISIPGNYPDAVAEAKATVVATVHDMLADVLAQTRPLDVPK